MATLPDLFSRATNANGTPESGAKRLTFIAGTTTPVTTYTTRDKDTAQAAELIADAGGDFDVSHVDSGLYKIRITDADDNVLMEKDGIRVADRPDDPTFLDDRTAIFADETVYSAGSIVEGITDASRYEIAASGATDHTDTRADGTKLYNLSSRNARAMEISASLPDGSITQRDGRQYLSKSDATGTDSCTNDLSQAGLVPFGEGHIDHYGRAMPIAVKDGEILHGNGAESDGLVATGTAISITGTGTGDGSRADRARVRDLNITVETGTTLAASPVVFDNAAFGGLDNMRIESADYQAVAGVALNGNSQVYSGLFSNVTVRGFIYSFDYHSAGSGAVFLNCFSYPESGTANGGTLRISTPNAQVIGGQHRRILVEQVDSGEEFHCSITGQSVETIEAGDYWLKVTGDTATGSSSSRFNGVEVTSTTFTGNAISGSGIIVDRAHGFRADIVCYNADSLPSGGYLVEVTEFAQDCVITCDFETAVAPWSVDASAVGITKKVTGPIPISKLDDIHTDPNLRVEVLGGLQEYYGLPIFHTGKGWSFHRDILNDNELFDFVPPFDQGRVVLFRPDNATYCFEGVYDLSAGTVTATAFQGSAVELTTGVITAEDGVTNNRVYLSVGDPGDGDRFYVLNTNGSSKTYILHFPMGI